VATSMSIEGGAAQGHQFDACKKAVMLFEWL
jgi:hypothetical protein